MFLKNSKENNFSTAVLHETDFLTRALTEAVADEHDVTIPFNAIFGTSEDPNLVEIYKYIAEQSKRNKDKSNRNKRKRDWEPAPVDLFVHFVTTREHQIPKVGKDDTNWRMTVAHKRFTGAVGISLFSRVGTLALTKTEQELFKNPSSHKYGSKFKNRTEVYNYCALNRYLVAATRTSSTRSDNIVASLYQLYSKQNGGNSQTVVLPDAYDVKKIATVFDASVLQANYRASNHPKSTGRDKQTNTVSLAAMVRAAKKFDLEELQSYQNSADLPLIVKMCEKNVFATKEEVLDALESLPREYLNKMFS